MTDNQLLVPSTFCHPSTIQHKNIVSITNSA